MYISAAHCPTELIKIVHTSSLIKNNAEEFFGNFLTQCHKEKIAYYDVNQPKVKSVKIPDIKDDYGARKITRSNNKTRNWRS